jgi:hypothetical protein
VGDSPISSDDCDDVVFAAVDESSSSRFLLFCVFQHDCDPGQFVITMFDPNCEWSRDQQQCASDRGVGPGTPNQASQPNEWPGEEVLSKKSGRRSFSEASQRPVRENAIVKRGFAYVLIECYVVFCC